MTKEKYQPTTELGAIVGKAGEGAYGCFTCGVITILILSVLLLAAGYYIIVKLR